MTSNRRRFSRIPFQIPARLDLPEGGCAVQIVDLSLKGALVRPEADVFATVGTNGVLSFALDETESLIEMEVTIVHREGGLFGLACREIDLDSVTHLRRLIELNVGDESILHRELHAFTK